MKTFDEWWAETNREARSTQIEKFAARAAWDACAAERDEQEGANDVPAESIHADQQRLTEVEAAKYLSIKRQTLAAWRCRRQYDLKYERIGKSIRYRLIDLERFCESRRVNAAAEAAARPKQPEPAA